MEWFIVHHKLLFRSKWKPNKKHNKSVSYTHLDVYKRQKQYSMEAIGNNAHWTFLFYNNLFHKNSFINLQCNQKPSFINSNLFKQSRPSFGQICIPIRYIFCWVFWLLGSPHQTRFECFKGACYREVSLIVEINWNLGAGFLC